MNTNAINMMAINNLKKCIESAKNNKIDETTIVKMIAEVYHPNKYKLANTLSPYAASFASKSALSAANNLNKYATNNNANVNANNYTTTTKSTRSGGKMRKNNKNKTRRRK